MVEPRAHSFHTWKGQGLRAWTSAAERPDRTSCFPCSATCLPEAGTTSWELLVLPGHTDGPAPCQHADSGSVGLGWGLGPSGSTLWLSPSPHQTRTSENTFSAPAPLPRGFLLCASLPTQSPAQGGAAVSQPVCPCIRGAGARAGDSEAKAGALQTVMFRVSLLINTATV